MAFRFKQFLVNDDRSTMKVGTDAVLLGAWVDVNNSKSILDIGTGCGVIALMLAQRIPDARVDAVEIDKSSAEQALENFSASPWKINVHNVAAQEFEGSFDLIVSNPPFFSKSLLPPTTGRQLARHTTTLSHEELIGAVTRLLKPHGRFGVIVPDKQLVEVASKYGLECTRAAAVYPRNKVERWLLEFSFNGKIAPKEDEMLILFDEGNERSRQYSDLTGEFYPKNS